jgi:hypothetical protein
MSGKKKSLHFKRRLFHLFHSYYTKTLWKMREKAGNTATALNLNQQRQKAARFSYYLLFRLLQIDRQALLPDGCLTFHLFLKF